MDSNAVSNNQCVLCTRTYTNDHVHCATVLECGHAFGRSCIVKWQENNSYCPTCSRPSVTPEDPSDASLSTLMKKDFHCARFPLCMVAFCTFVYSPNLKELAVVAATTFGTALCTYGAVHACSSVHNLIRQRLGLEPIEETLSLRNVASCRHHRLKTHTHSLACALAMPGAPG